MGWGEYRSPHPIFNSNLRKFFMKSTISFQEVIEYVEALSREEQELLLEIFEKRIIEKRRSEISNNAAQTLASIEAGTAKRGTLANLRADLIGEE